MKQTVLVIGGGMAGVAAAVHHAEHGRHVIVAEANPSLGGRARSFTDRTTGDVIDNGQHLIMGCYTSFLHMATVLGVGNTFTKQDALRVRFIDADGTSTVLDAGKLPGTAGMALALATLGGVAVRSRLAALRFALRLRTGRIRAEGLSCRELLVREGQHPDMIRRFWEPVVLATCNATLDDAAAVLLTEVMRRAFLAGGDASSLYVPTQGLSAYTDPLPMWLEGKGGTVMLSTSVEHLTWDGQRVTAATLSNGEVVHVDAVVCAIPPFALRRLLAASPGVPVEVDDLSMSPIVSVYCWYADAWMNDDMAALLGTTVQWVFNRRRLTPCAPDVERAYPGHVALTVSAGDGLVDMDTDAIVALCDAELRRAFPAMGSTALLHARVIKERRATIKATAEAHARRPHPHAASNVWLAGDWVQTHLPATIEGACWSGTVADVPVATVR